MVETCPTMFVIWIVLVVLVYAFDARAENSDRSPDRSVERQVSVTLSGAFTNILRADWTGAVEHALDESGLGDDYPGGCLWGICAPPSSFPMSDIDAGLGGIIMVRIPTQSRFYPRVIVTKYDDFGTVRGNHERDPDVVGDIAAILSVSPSLTTVTAAATFNLLPFVWVGSGVSLHRVQSQVRMTTDVKVNIRDKKTESALSVMFDFDARYPAQSRIFAEASFRYYLLQDITIGPYEIMGFDDEVRISFPETDLSLSHGLVSLGLGFRLWIPS